MLTTTLKLYKTQVFTWYIGNLTNRRFLLVISLKTNKNINKNIKTLNAFWNQLNILNNPRITALVKINSKNIKYSVKDNLKIFIDNFQNLFVKFKNRKKIFFYNIKEKNNFLKQKNYTEDNYENNNNTNNFENTKYRFLINQKSKIYIFINLAKNNNLLNIDNKIFKLNQTPALKILNIFLIVLNSFALISTIILPFFFKNFVNNSIKSKFFWSEKQKLAADLIDYTWDYYLYALVYICLLILFFKIYKYIKTHKQYKIFFFTSVITNSVWIVYIYYKYDTLIDAINNLIQTFLSGK
jgi:hypothetical protein